MHSTARFKPPIRPRTLAAVATAFAVLACGAGASAQTAGADPGPDYVLTPTLDATGAKLVVRVTFKAAAEGQTRLRTPLAFASEVHLDRNISGWSAEGATIARRAPGTITLAHRPGAVVTLSYDVRSGRVPGVIRDRLDYQPDISSSGVLAFGEAVLAYPEGSLHSPARLRLATPPAGWQAYSDAETAVTGPETVEDVLHSVVVAGPDVRLQIRDVGGARLRIAFRGAFNFTDDAFADTEARIVRAERRFWSDDRCPCFMSVDALEGSPGDQHQAGIGRTHGAALFASPHLYLENFAYVMAHEPTHAWLPARLGGLPPGPAEAGAYWFSEGFTDFIAYRILLDTGIWKPRHYVALGLSRTAEDRALPQRQLADDYWTNPDLYQLPYVHGLLLAVIWDARLQRASGGRLGLGDVLRAQSRQAQTLRGGPTADVLFPSVYKAVSGLDLSDDIARYVVAGETPQPPDDIYPGCLTPFRPAPSGRDETGNPAARRGSVAIGPKSFDYVDDGDATEARCLKLMSGR